MSIFETTHTVERALENLIGSQDVMICLKCILPYLGRIGDEGQNGKTSAISLTSFRIFCKLIKDVPEETLTEHLPSIMPHIYKALVKKSVDMRKTSVFCIVQMYLVLGQEKMNPYLEDLNVAQRKLVKIYIDRHNRLL